MLECVAQVLEDMGIGVLERSPDYKLKCLFKNSSAMVEEEANEDSCESEDLNDEVDEVKAYSKREITFHIQVFTAGSKLCNCVDMSLVSGHPFVYLALSRQFYSLLEKKVPLEYRL